MSVPDDDRSIADAADDVPEPGGSKRYAYIYLTGLFVSIAGGLIGAVAVGIIDPEITVSASVSVGWIVEGIIAAIAAAFIFWTFAQITNVLGVDFVAGVVGVVARIADNYQLPGDVDQEND